MGTISFALMFVLVCTINSVKPFTIHYNNLGTFDYSSHLGNYNYRLDLPDQQREENGLVELRGAKEESYAVRGKYSFTLGGQLHTVYYTSDQDGYRARVVNGKPMASTSTPIQVYPQSGSGGTAGIPKDVTVTTKKPDDIRDACRLSILGCGGK